MPEQEDLVLLPSLLEVALEVKYPSLSLLELTDELAPDPVYVVAEIDYHTRFKSEGIGDVKYFSIKAIALC